MNIEKNKDKNTYPETALSTANETVQESEGIVITFRNTRTLPPATGKSNANYMFMLLIGVLGIAAVITARKKKNSEIKITI